DDNVPRQIQSREDQIDMMLAPPLLVLSVPMRVTLGDDVDDRAVGRERDVLLQPCDADARPAPHRAGVGRHLAADDLAEGRLTGAIASDDRDALARFDLQRHLVEQRQMAERDRYAVQRDEW